MLYEPVVSPPNPVNQVFRRLARQQHASSAALEADQFNQTLDNLAARHADALIESYFSNGLLGRLLLQSGVAVYASLGDRVGLEALEDLLAQADKGQHRVFPLEPLALALACAAVDGVAVAVPRFGLAGLTDHLSHERLMGFNGVVAAERGMGLLIWQFQTGQAQQGPTDIPDISSDRVTQLAWVTRLLPAVGDIIGRAAQWGQRPAARPAPAPPVPTPARPQPVQSQAGAATPDAWIIFSKVMAVHLGSRAARLVHMTRQEYGELQGDDLNAQLLWQIERVGGRGAVQEFRQKMNI